MKDALELSLEPKVKERERYMEKVEKIEVRMTVGCAKKIKKRFEEEGAEWTEHVGKENLGDARDC